MFIIIKDDNNDDIYINSEHIAEYRFLKGYIYSGFYDTMIEVVLSNGKVKALLKRSKDIRKNEFLFNCVKDNLIECLFKNYPCNIEEIKKRAEERYNKDVDKSFR